MFTHRFENLRKWNVDDDGFLRCRSTILKTGILKYHRSEIPDENIPDHITDDWIYLLVDESELSNPESIKTLEGKPLVSGHKWQEAGSMSDVGNIAGAPYYDDGYLCADCLVTDLVAKDQVMLDENDPRKLRDLSSAYDSGIEWKSGYNSSGEFYHGRQVNIRYNHVALLPIGDGRAGSDVRILNKKGDSKTMEFTSVKFGNSRIRVANEDMEKMSGEMERTENEMMSPEMKTKLAEYEEMKGKMSTLEGELMAMKEELEAALAKASPEAVQEAAEVMNAEKEEAKDMMNGYKMENSAEILKAHGVELKASVINAIRVQNGKPELSEDQAKDASFVAGVWSVMKDSKPAAAPAKKPAFAPKLQNKAVTDLSDNKARAQKLYGGNK